MIGLWIYLGCVLVGLLVLSVSGRWACPVCQSTRLTQGATTSGYVCFKVRRLSGVVPAHATRFTCDKDHTFAVVTEDVSRRQRVVLDPDNTESRKRT